MQAGRLRYAANRSETSRFPLFLDPVCCRVMFTLGIDYGINSVRALLVRCTDGPEFGASVVNYPPGRQGVLLDPKDHNLARQHPADYLFGLERSVKAALAAAKKKRGFSADKIVGLGVDTTGSSPIPVDAQ